MPGSCIRWHAFGKASIQRQLQLGLFDLGDHGRFDIITLAAPLLCEHLPFKQASVNQPLHQYSSSTHQSWEAPDKPCQGGQGPLDITLIHFLSTSVSAVMA